MIGMIVWPKAKRSVSTATAKEIVAAARANGAEPVGALRKLNPERKLI